jgi:hypothetical protein
MENESPDVNVSPDLSVGPEANVTAAESAKKPNTFIVALLLVAVLGLSALNIYQDHVIASQRVELHWMMEHGTFRYDAAAPPGVKAPASAPQPGAQGQASGATLAPVAEKTPAQPAPTKP